MSSSNIGGSVPTKGSAEKQGNAASRAIAKMLPKQYDAKKALLAAAITLIVFLIGVLSGSYFPWWVTIIIGVAIVFGGFVGMAHFDTAFDGRKIK